MSDQKKKLISWAESVIQGNLSDFEEVVGTPWSTVLKLTTQDDVLYLKQTPPDLSIEVDVLRVIQENINPSYTPKVLFKNPTLHCFIMESCGDHSLRTKFNGKLDPDLLFKGLGIYSKIQRAFESNVADLDAVGVPDWRIQRLPALYNALIDDEKRLLEEGLTRSEIAKLKALHPKIQSLCDVFSKSPIQETLVNCDFNDNNLIINEATQEISVIDWGESVISHPFFSIASFFNSLARRYQLKIDGKLLRSIRQKWIMGWSDVSRADDLEMHYQNILQLQPIFFSLVLNRLQEATDQKSQARQTWFIKDSLQSLLKN